MMQYTVALIVAFVGLGIALYIGVSAILLILITM
jgi:hypothetical protein